VKRRFVTPVTKSEWPDSTLEIRAIDTALIIFGFVTLIAPVAVILWNYLRKGEDLVSSKHLFVIGVSNFMGVAGLTTGVRQLYRGNQIAMDVVLLFAAVALFFTCFWWSYNRWRAPVRVAHKLWRKSPPANIVTITTIGGVSAVLGLFASALPIDIPVIGQIINNLGKLLPAAAVALFIFAWLRNPLMVMYLAMAGGALMIAVFTALFGSGRHPLFAAVVAIPIAWYWGSWRYSRPTATIGRMTALGIGVIFLILVYSGFRHDFNGDADSGIAMDRIKQLLEFRLETSSYAEDWLNEDAITVALLCIEEFNRKAGPDYFHTVRYVLSNPIPRDWWPDKPEALGQFLPRDRGEWVDGKVNWGPSIIGNAFHDGGLWMAGLYGLVIGAAFRVFDQLMTEQPNNPWLVMLLAAASPKIVALSRGDITIYIVAIIGLIVVTTVALRIAMMIFGKVDEWEFSDGVEYDPEIELEFEGQEG
jgi:hypothetical protein